MDDVTAGGAPRTSTRSGGADPVPTVLMTTDAVGGVWTYASTLANALASRGMRVVLACLGPAPTAAQRRQVSARSNVEVVVGDYRLEWMDDPWDDVQRAGEWLLELEARFEVDLVHLNGFVHATWPFRSPVIVVAHSCVSSWWRAVHGEDPPPSWDRYRVAVRAGLTAAKRLVVPTAAMGRALLAANGLEDAREFSVIHNGLAASASPMGAGIDGRDELVFAAGRLWDEAKNVGVLDAVAEELRWPVWVAGDPRAPDGREFTADGMCMLGQLSTDQVHAWMSRAAVFAVPSLYEPFGLAALEAAQRGCALVLSDLPSHREVWGDAALYVSPKDVSGWVEAIGSLMGDVGSRVRLARAAQERARRYDVERMTDEYLGLYREFIRPLPQRRAVQVTESSIGRSMS